MIYLYPNYAVGNIGSIKFLEASHSLILDGLVDSGARVTLVGLNAKTSFDASFVSLSRPSVEFASIGEVPKSAYFAKRIVFSVRQVYSLLKVVLVSEFSYLYLPGTVGSLASVFCWIFKKPYAVYVRGDLRTSAPRLFRPFHRRILEDAQFVLCTGSELKDEIKSINEKVEAVVPMSPVLFGENTWRRVPRDSEALRILFVGQIIRSKGIFELLEAFDRVGERTGRTSKLIFVGDGDDLTRLKAHVRDLGIEDNVECRGAITDTNELISIYNSSDVFCLPTYYPEGFPRVLYEAMRFALPIVTTPVGQISTVIKQGVNGFLCEPQSIDSLTDKLLLLLDSKDERVRVGREGYETLVTIREQWKEESHGHQVVKWLRETGFSNQVSGNSMTEDSGVSQHIIDSGKRI